MTIRGIISDRGNRGKWTKGKFSHFSTRRAQRQGVSANLFILLLCLLTFVHQRRYASATPASRLDLLHSLVLRGTFSIDSYRANTSDVARFGGHCFSDKAPGTVCLALPAFSIAAAILFSVGIPVDSEIGWLVTSWAACAGSIAVIASLGGVALFRWLATRVDARSALVTVLALFLGAAPLPYSTFMFSHALVVGFLGLAVWAIAKRDERCGEAKQSAVLTTERCLGNPTATVPLVCRIGNWVFSNRFDALAGFCCGWAVASEYTSGLIVIGLWVWAVLPNWRRGIPLLCGSIPPLLLIPLYSWACLGQPFALPYSFQASFPQMKEGLYAIKWPDAETALRLLFSTERGLFFWTPFLLMAILGYPALFRKSKSLFWLTCTVPIIQVAVISGRVWDWPAGPTLGPRYLAPILPLMALPCAVGVQQFPMTGRALASYSILITTLATLTSACLDFNSHPDPLFDLNIPLLLEGKFSPNIAMELGVPPYVSITIFYLILLGGFAWLWNRVPSVGLSCPVPKVPADNQ
jgi:hypothetical protein